MCTGPLFPISSYSALFIPLKPSFLGKGHQSSIICIIFIKILQIFFIILSTSLKIGIQITLCRKMWLLSRSALAQRSSSLLLRSACLYQSLTTTALYPLPSSLCPSPIQPTLPPVCPCASSPICPSARRRALCAGVTSAEDQSRPLNRLFDKRKSSP